MEGAVETVNGRISETGRQPSPKDIGREFVRQYYTMLSEKPEEVFRFYSHESFFVHDQEAPVQGQQRIQKAIEQLGFEECKARIYTVNGTATMNSGLVVQVCGELSLGGNPGRRFIQTFILCPQTPKKYYVHNDVFQWLDRAFGEGVTELKRKNEIHMDTPTSDEDSTNDESPSLNGHTQPITDSDNSVEPRSVESSVESMTEKSEEPVSTVTSTISKISIEEENDDSPDNNESSEETVEEKTEDTVVADSTESAEKEQPTLVGDATPKTWAKLVGSRTTVTAVEVSHTAPVNPPAVPAQPIVRMPPQRSMTTTPPIQSTDNNVINNNSNVQLNRQAWFPADDRCRLYIGGIARSIFPDSAAEVEREIRDEFEKFGPVATVNVPKRAVENADIQRALYAFVVMKTVEGARNAFNATRKDRSLSLLPLTLKSVGFSGEVILSEQRGYQMNRMQYTHRGPPMQNSPRGGFGMRGGGGGGGMGRPGPRGMNPRNYNVGNEFRQFSDYGRH